MKSSLPLPSFHRGLVALAATLALTQTGCAAALLIAASGANQAMRDSERQQREEEQQREEAAQQKALAAKEAERTRRLTPEKLDASQVVELRLLPPEEGLCPGDSSRVRVAAVLRDGKTKETWVSDDEKAGFIDDAEFTFESPHGTFEEGEFQVAKDPLATMKSGISIRARLTSAPTVAVEKTFPPSYACLRPPFFEGPEGAYGEEGQWGGQYGQAGRGGTGGSGGSGGPGVAVTAHVGYSRSPFYEKLLIIKAFTANGEPRWYVAPVDSKKKVSIASAGGRGGEGGRGGSGGAGSMHSRGNTYPGSDGGDGGAGGPGGPGGPGGSLAILYDARHPELQQLVEGGTPGGDGGPGGSGGYGGAGGSGDPSGANGAYGPNGPQGPDGPQGTPATYQAAPANKLFAGHSIELL